MRNVERLRQRLSTLAACWSYLDSIKNAVMPGPQGSDGMDLGYRLGMSVSKPPRGFQCTARVQVENHQDVE